MVANRFREQVSVGRVFNNLFLKPVPLAIILLLMFALPTQAQVLRPGADFKPEPEWSEEFAQGMLAIRHNDLGKAEEHFQKCANNEKKIDPDCEYYLAIMYQAKGDVANFRKWLNIAASHGQPMAVTAVDLMERFK